jgi:hypothetical protein
MGVQGIRANPEYDDDMKRLAIDVVQRTTHAKIQEIRKVYK